MRLFKEVILPARRLVLQHAQVLQLFGINIGALRHDGEVDFRGLDDVLHQVQRQLGFLRRDIRRGVGVGQADGDIVELLDVGIADLLGGLDLQGARMETHAGGGHGDAAFIGEVLERLHVRGVGQPVIGHRAEGGDGLDVLLALGAVPQGEHWRQH